MIHPRLIVPVLALALLSAVGCSKDPPPPPAPTGPTAEELAEARADSIADAQARQTAEAERLAREAEMAEQRRREAARADALETLREMIHFEYDQADVTPRAERLLRAKVDILRANPSIELRIEGHADERGSTEYNLALANRRAESVRQFFTNFGLDADRFAIVSYGEERPLVNRSDEAAWAQNRRAEFVITAGEVRVSRE